MITQHSHIINDDIIVQIISASMAEEIEAEGIVSALQSRRLTYFADLLRQRVMAFHDPQQRYRSLELLGQVTIDSADRLLRSPMLCGLLRLGGEPDNLISIIENELLLDAADDVVYVNSWSALGNVWLGEHMPMPSLPFQQTHGRFVTPSLRCGVPLDYSLAAFVGRPDAGLHSPELLTSDETQTAIDNLENSLNLLREIYPLGYSLLIHLTSNIVLRAEQSRRKDAWGATSGAVIGRVVLVNPNAAANRYFLGEILLHETMHIALDCIELTAPFFRDASVLSANSIVSPWTGNTLSVHAFLHACAVWAVLLKFWERSMENGFVSENGRARYHYIRDGFRKMNLTDLAKFKSALSESALNMIEVSKKIGTH